MRSKTKLISERSVQVRVHEVSTVSKKMPVFYNPEMVLNRDIAVLIARQVKPKKVLDALAGSGVRSLRFVKEAGCTNVLANDLNRDAVKLIKRNAKQNDVSLDVRNEDATELLLKEGGFDFIDLDVFGSPNPFLDAAVKRLSRYGVLAVTATDTAALSGTYPRACRRKYWSIPIRNEQMHEIGLRILVRKLQLIGAQYDKGLRPLFCHATRHYMRVYVQNEAGKKTVDNQLSMHLFFHYCPACGSHSTGKRNFVVCTCKKAMLVAGPLFAGNLWDASLVQKMKTDAPSDIQKFMDIIAGEAAIESVGIHDIHVLCKKMKRVVPPMQPLIGKIAKTHPVARTHLKPTAIRSPISAEELLRLISQ